VGKSHFLTAIGNNLLKALRNKTILYTTGPRLCRAADIVGVLRKTEDFLTQAAATEALLIDDAHLMTFSERSQTVLKALTKQYFDRGKPIMMSSVYSPRALQFVEEGLGLEIGSGYAVEIKLGSIEVQTQILRAACSRLGLDATDEESRQLLGMMGGTFVEINRYLRRLRALKAIRASKKESVDFKDLFAQLVARTEKAPPAPSTLEEMAVALRKMPGLETSSSPAAKIVGLVYPSGHENHAQYLLRQFRDAAKRLGLAMPIKSLATQGYDPNQLYGVPASIGEACRRSGASVILLLGPLPRTQLSAHEPELVHALEHILANLEISISSIPFLAIGDPDIYFRAVLDVYSGLWAEWKP
jgi:hypothetical protein